MTTTSFFSCQLLQINYAATKPPVSAPGLVSIVLSKHPSELWHGHVAASIGYAVSMTHDQATIWRYTIGTGLNDSSKPLLVRLEHPPSAPQSPLPFGLLVPTSAEPGFLVVMPTSGNITYWESVLSAASIDLHRQKQQATQGAVGGMLSGEIITKVTEGEPHGFILTFSTGRIAHMTFCDPQGKPSINVQYLRSNTASIGSLFGSLRNVFSSSGWRRDIAAVKAGSSWQRGQRYALIGTTQGIFQLWDLRWNGTHSLVFEADATTDLRSSLREDGNVDEQVDPQLEILDFTFLPIQVAGNEVAKLSEKMNSRLLVLTVSKGGSGSARYALIGMNLTENTLDVEVVHPITCYTDIVQQNSNWQPQLLVPEPGQMAFVIFETSIVLVSLMEIEESPSSQLQMEAHTLPDPFQDVIDFRRNKAYRIVGCAAEPFDRSQRCSSCIFMVFGFGVIRVSALPLEEGLTAFDRAAVTAKTKIEQAVFYGTLPQDLIDFSGRREISFDKAEIEEAALQVSESIMKSTSTYIPSLSPSMDQQLQRRASALADLIKYLVNHHKYLDRVTRWQLLWDAERLSASQALWRYYNTAIANKPEGDQNLLSEIVDMVHQDYKLETQPEKYETDIVRHWFIHDVWRMEYIIPFAQVACERLFEESVGSKKKQEPATQARLLCEGNDLILATLDTAYKFREQNTELYGVNDEPMIDGVLRGGYEDLPEPWTSRENIVIRVKLLVDLSREMAITHDEEEGGVMGKLVERLVATNPFLVQICCQTYIERFRWLKSRDDPELKAHGKKLQKEHFEVRKTLFVKLSDIGLGQDGIKLAEKYHDMGALADIIHHGMEEALQRSRQPGGPDSERDEAIQIIELIKKQVQSYFGRFGRPWADAYFTKHIELGKSIEVLNNTESYKSHLTSFLRNHPAYAKLSWINEVLSEHNYAAAADSLRMAQEQDTNLWSKKISLSMGKLAILAAKSQKQAKDDSVENAIQKVDRHLAILTAQEKFYDYIRVTFKNAIDVTAETDLATEQYCKHFVERKPALREVLAVSISRMIARQALDLEELIDALTLIDEDSLHPDEEGFADSRFFTALKLLRLGSFEDDERARKGLHEKIIWRRCMIQDDWEAINRTELKDDTQVEVETGATALFKTLRECYKSGMLFSLFQSNGLIKC